MDLSDKLEELKNRAQEAATEHKDEIRGAVRKAQLAADEQTGGRYHEQITKAGAKAEQYLERLTAEQREGTGPDAPGAPDAPRAPDGPDAPRAPDAPDAPRAPDGPDAPGAPDAPEPS